ncbi:hypothetical protein D1133_10690 [Turicibacter sp. TS3]|uniref:Uncharacterized protein n=1 Tax=Senegalia massiliensis TaxID=1720316 RepID=A0A845R452_9CLOT|nr:hypothetical protein [Senegalia massiliensis]NCE79517.1 hypothetical protein [Turicibacter sp. TS3]
MLFFTQIGDPDRFGAVVSEWWCFTPGGSSPSTQVLLVFHPFKNEKQWLKVPQNGRKCPQNEQSAQQCTAPCPSAGIAVEEVGFW